MGRASEWAGGDSRSVNNGEGSYLAEGAAQQRGMPSTKDAFLIILGRGLAQQRVPHTRWGMSNTKDVFNQIGEGSCLAEGAAQQMGHV